VRIARRAVGGVVKPDEDEPEDGEDGATDEEQQEDVAETELDEDPVANDDEAVSDRSPA